MPRKSKKDQVSQSMPVRHVLRGHSGKINRVAWSPEGSILASPSDDYSIHLWNIHTGECLQILKGHNSAVLSVAWSPDGKVLASGSEDHDIFLWNVETGEHLRTFTGHFLGVSSLAWSPDGKILASGSADQTIRFWNAQTGRYLKTLTGHDIPASVACLAWSPDGKVLASGSAKQDIHLWNGQTGQLLQTISGHARVPYGREWTLDHLSIHSDAVFSIAWSPDGKVLASGSADQTIRLWNTQTGQHIRTLEGHTYAVTSISFSSDGSLLASKSDTIRIWRTDTWETVVLIEETHTGSWLSGLSFHPNTLLLAAHYEEDTVLRIWELNADHLLKTPAVTSSVHYTNAKVVLVGDSGVGKSGLSLVLIGQPFTLTESTHGRRVWIFDSRRVVLNNGIKETRETLLWDLAGQPNYRLVHQLHLNEVAVALVLFDARSETDPFAGVLHWDRALRQAERVQGGSTSSLKKFLVAARVDRGTVGVSHERLDALVQELNFDGYFETSAKEGWHIAELKAAIREAINWEVIPKVSSTKLFQSIRSFLIAEKEAGRLLTTIENLYGTFLRSGSLPAESEDLLAQFETCIGRVESAGLIKRLSFGKLILLQPEQLDAYASALVNAVKDEPDGLGSISEDRVRMGEFRMPEQERLKDKDQEKLLLIAMVEDLLRRELALREESFLVFPSQSTRENPDLPDPEGKRVIFTFEGAVFNIYTTLAVRLSHSGLFKKMELWKNAIIYTANVGGTCGMFLKNIGEGRGELTLFFDKAASEETRLNFENYVQLHLHRRALSETLNRRSIVNCENCGFLVTDQLIRLRSERGFDWINCPVCSKRFSLLGREKQLISTPSLLVEKMDRAADTQRELSAAALTLQGKIVTQDFDVFLGYNSKDKAKVKEIGEKLKERGVLPWFDEWQLQPGLPWQRLLTEQIEHIKSAAIFVGKDGVGPWQQEELESFLSEFVRRGCPVIPVLLGDARKIPELPLFLKNRTWVDFRRQDSDPIERLIWGITGKRISIEKSNSITV